MFLYAPSALEIVASLAKMMLHNLNENKLSRLYGALHYYLNTKALPADYTEIKNLNSQPNFNPLPQPAYQPAVA